MSLLNTQDAVQIAEIPAYGVNRYTPIPETAIINFMEEQ